MTMSGANRILRVCQVDASRLCNVNIVAAMSEESVMKQALSPETPVREVMSKEVLYCFEDETTEQVAKNMRDQKVRRLPVLNRKKRLVGIVSIGDLAWNTKPNVTGQVLAGISRPGGAHSQTRH